MITDYNLRVSTDQAITGTAYSTGSVDKKVAMDIGEGRNLYMVFTVTEVFNILTNLVITCVEDTLATLGGTNTVLATSAPILLASLKVGYQVVLPIPPIIASKGLRYLGAKYTVNGSDPSTGKITADIVTDIQDGRKYYASGFSVT